MRFLLIPALVLATSAPAIIAQTNVSFELKSDPTKVLDAGPIVTGDFNNDGKPDIVYAGGSTNQSDVTVRFGNGDGTFQAPMKIATTDGQVVDMVSSDFDKDGYLDVAVACQGGTFDVYFGNAGGTWAVPAHTASQAASLVSITAGDFDGNGQTDLAVADGSGAVEVYNNYGGRDFIFKKSIAIENTQIFKVRAGDFDNDGIQNLAVLTSDTAFVVWNDGHENFTKATLASYPDVAGYGNTYGLAIGDLNQDGMQDILVSYDCNSNNDTPGRSDPTPCQGFSAWYGQGQQKLYQKTLLSFSGTIAARSVQIADVDGHGVADLVATTDYGAVYVYLGTPAGYYSAAAAKFPVGQYVGPLASADFNRDGQIDFVTANNSSHFEFYLNATPRSACTTSKINPTVTICAPVDNTYLPGPSLSVQANAYDTRQVTAIQLYANGTLKSSLNSSVMNQNFALGTGSFFLVVKAWDATGLSFRSQRNIHLYTGTPGVVCTAAPNSARICLPGSTVNGSSVHILANGATSAIPTSAQLYIDGHLTLQDNGTNPNGGSGGGTSFIDTYQTLATGRHNLVFKLWSADGNVYTAEQAVTVQ